MTSREEVEQARRRYTDIPRADLPDWLRNPSSEHEFTLALLVAKPSVTPTYDEHEQVIGFQGIGLRGQ